MNKSLLKYLSSVRSSKLNGNTYYRRIRTNWLKPRVGQPCYLCGVATTRQPVPAGTRPKPSHITLEHYVPVWFLKAIDVPEGIIHPPNFRVCCHRCNYLRGLRVTTVAELRADVGDELVDKLMAISGVHLPDDYHYKLKTPAK